VFLVGAAIGAFAELKGILDDQSKANAQSEASLTTQTQTFAQTGTLPQLQAALQGIQDYEKQLNNGLGADNLAFQLNIDNVRTNTDQQIATLKAQIAALGGPSGADAANARQSMFNAASATSQQNALSSNAARLFGLPQLMGITPDWVAAINANTEAVNRATAHSKAKDALGGIDAFLKKFRGTDAAIAIKDFPKELAYMSTVSDEQKKSPIYHRGLVENIAALKKDMVGATASQKLKLSADIKALQALDASRLSSISAKLSGTLSVNVANINALMALQNTKDQGSSIRVGVTARSVTTATTGSRRTGPTRVGNIGASGYTAGGQ
jgi:hypothetical protein